MSTVAGEPEPTGRAERRDIATTLEAFMQASYGRILALLAASDGAVMEAEDALSQAMMTAWQTWARDGIPDRPEAWLLTVARHHRQNRWRQAGVASRHARALLPTAESDDADVGLVDRRLALLFVCAHPAIATDVRAPLMLQCIFGLTAEQIARLYLEAPATLGQRLVRGKRRIQDLRIPFQVPDPEAMPERLDAVLQALYGAFTAAAMVDEPWPDGRDGTINLARLTAQCLPSEPEAQALLALMLCCKARHPAARDEQGRLIPLDQQHPELWDNAFIQEAQECFGRCARPLQSSTPGRFTVEAAIHLLHCQRRPGQEPPWPELLALYDLLLAHHHSLGAVVARLAVQARVDGPAAAMRSLEAQAPSWPADFLPAKALKADLLASLGRYAETAAAYREAAELANAPCEQAWLWQRAQANDTAAQGGPPPTTHGLS